MDVLPDGVADRLRAAYATPPRSYHTWAHATAVAVTAAELGGDRPVLLAAWFHDAVYERQPGRDEARSADLASAWLAGDPDAEETARLVRLTAGHDPAPDDRRGAVLCDADLAVLAAGPDGYEAYRSAVRREYAHVDDDAWRAGRAVVLEGLLARPAIYRTTEGRRRWEALARHNVTAELAALTGC
jgi:predicted metal-dependent HD superfamily phosphohydrolase